MVGSGKQSKLNITKNRQQRAVTRVYIMMRAPLGKKTDIIIEAKWKKKGYVENTGAASKSLWRHQHSFTSVTASSNFLLYQSFSFGVLKSRSVSSRLGCREEEDRASCAILTRTRTTVVLRKDRTKASTCYSFADFRADLSQELFWFQWARPALSLRCHSYIASGTAITLVMWCCYESR